MVSNCWNVTIGTFQRFPVIFERRTFTRLDLRAKVRQITALRNLSMSSPIAGGAATNSTVVEFLGLTSKEAQFALLCNLFLTAQTTYNTTNPANSVIRVSIEEDLADVVIRTAFKQSDTAASQTLVAGVIASEFPATKLTDAAATGDVAALIALPTLEAQILSLAVTLQSEETAYNVANPTLPVNRMTIGPNFDNRSTAIVATLPLSPSATSRPVIPYLP